MPGVSELNETLRPELAVALRLTAEFPKVWRDKAPNEIFCAVNCVAANVAVTVAGATRFINCGLPVPVIAPLKPVKMNPGLARADTASAPGS